MIQSHHYVYEFRNPSFKWKRFSCVEFGDLVYNLVRGLCCDCDIKLGTRIRKLSQSHLPQTSKYHFPHEKLLINYHQWNFWNIIKKSFSFKLFSKQGPQKSPTNLVSMILPFQWYWGDFIATRLCAKCDFIPFRKVSGSNEEIEQMCIKEISPSLVLPTLTTL